MLNKQLGRSLQRDFIPEGPVYTGDVTKLPFRRTLDHEVYQCCTQTGTDYPQSGPIYCGRVAEFIAFLDGYTYLLAFCEEHAKRKCIPIAMEEKK